MRKIYKYPLDFVFRTGKCCVEMPEGYDILHFAVQRGMPTIWAAVDTDRPTVCMQFQRVGTGFKLDEAGYVGTYFEGPFVWHVFEEPAEDGE